MTGFVVVSHSEKVAKGIKEICEQFSNKDSFIIDAGGIDDRIGTDVIKIKSAIEEAFNNSSDVLVFGDLGSSILSAETAIDLLEDDIKEKVTLVDAPIVEGMIAGVISASITQNIEEIIYSARETRTIDKF